MLFAGFIFDMYCATLNSNYILFDGPSCLNEFINSTLLIALQDEKSPTLFSNLLLIDGLSQIENEVDIEVE